MSWPLHRGRKLIAIPFLRLLFLKLDKGLISSLPVSPLRLFPNLPTINTTLPPATTFISTTIAPSLHHYRDAIGFRSKATGGVWKASLCWTAHQHHHLLHHRSESLPPTSTSTTKTSVVLTIEDSLFYRVVD